MQVFVYEFVTGGGFFHVQDAPPDGSLLREGQAMVAALVQDFQNVDGVRVVTSRDARLSAAATASVVVADAGEDEAAFAELSASSDFTLVVAPEFDGHLQHRIAALETWGRPTLGVNRQFCACAADKTVCCDRLSQHGVRVPRGALLADGGQLPQDFLYPAVLKPNDGAGSLGLCYLPRAQPSSLRGPMRLEEFVEGTACSVSFFCRGARPPLSCPPMFQDIDRLDQFQYRGGGSIQDGRLAARARGLGRQVLEALPATIGFVGVDLLLGAPADGSQDYAIEVNPRVTTSYVGVRQLATSNLAAAMLAIARSEAPLLDWIDRPVAFHAGGTVA